MVIASKHARGLNKGRGDVRDEIGNGGNIPVFVWLHLRLLSRRLLPALAMEGPSEDCFRFLFFTPLLLRVGGLQRPGLVIKKA